MQLLDWLQKQYGALIAEIKEMQKALQKQVHDDAKVLAEWDAETDETQRDNAFKQLNTMLARSTGSINNSYLKVQIATGLTIGLIALFLTVFGQLKQVTIGLLVAGVVMNAASIGLSLLVTTPRWKTTWTEVVEEPGVFALKQKRREEYLSLSRRAFHNRVVLLGNRRIAWLATWLLTIPGLVLAMLSWAWSATIVALAIILGTAWVYRKVLGGGRPSGSRKYPAS